jgi:catechol 2,3-dioxygenase-like lactoylglutathione lyase family enzyme
MFTDTKAFSSFAVPDIEAARRFYGETLGLRTSQQDDLLTIHLADGHDVMIYPKPDHQPANYTVLHFQVDDVERAVEELTARGVEMLRYEGFSQDERGISREAGAPPVAWFADPAGNIIGLPQI